MEQTTTVSQQNPETAYDTFLQYHALQLYAINFPKALESKLYAKLKAETYDMGSKVKIMLNEEEDQIYLQSSEPMKSEESVYLIDHAWTFKFRDAEKTLRENEGLLKRMKNIVKYSSKMEMPNNPYEKKRPALSEYLESQSEQSKAWDLDGYELTTLEGIKFGEGTEEISLFNNELESPAQVTEYLLPLTHLKALWLNGNPVVDACVNFNSIGEVFTSLEILNSKFTTKAGAWSMMYYARDQQPVSLADIRKLDLSGKGVLSLKDLSVFDEMTTLKEIDISDHPEMFMSDEELLAEEQKMKEGSGEQGEIEFVRKSHSIEDLLSKLKWVEKLTCDERLEEFILQNREILGFLPQLKQVNGVSVRITDKDQRVKEREVREVMDKLWMHVGTYRLVTEAQMDEESIWYLMDEVGSYIKHSDQPNFAVHPFIYSPNNALDDQTTTYQICWPLKDIQADENIYRDFLCGIDESKFRSTRYSVWFDTPEEYFLEQLRLYREIKPQVNSAVEHQKYQDKYPKVAPLEVKETPLKVYTDYGQILDHLTDKRFVCVDDPNASDICWSTIDYYNVLKSAITDPTKKHYINQFQGETAFVMKHHLANLVRLTLEDPSIIQETIVLNDYLPAFVGRYLERAKLALDNTWILKPINMARSLDTWVTNNIDSIIRMVETGPKIAQKYIERPCLLGGKKFDLRYVALLKSVLPLELGVYEEFYTRFSNNPFTMDEDSFAEYETHFTVMNYKEGVKLTNLRYFDFEKQFDEEYKGKTTWAEVHKKIVVAIKQVFLAFQVKYGEDLEKTGNSQMCRSLYGVDVMVTEDFEPKILEVTFSPDCKRACVFNPDFFNEVFGYLFFNETKNIAGL